MIQLFSSLLFLSLSSLFLFFLLFCHPVISHPVDPDALTLLTTPTKRLLQDFVSNNNYNIQFQSCHSVRGYVNGDGDFDTNPSTMTKLDQYVLFRLCPKEKDQQKCNSVNNNNNNNNDDKNNSDTTPYYYFGEYIIDIETYLQYVIPYQKIIQDEICKQCSEECDTSSAAVKNNNDNDNNLINHANMGQEFCNSTCQEKECALIQNLEEKNGYIDATVFSYCQIIYYPEDDILDSFYAGPICASGGSKIEIGVFLDRECNELDPNKDVNDYLVNNKGDSIRLSHALLKNAYLSGVVQMDCSLVSAAQDNNKLCDGLYNESAKCEEPPSEFEESDVSATTRSNNNDNNNYHGQLEKEVCDFIDQLKKGGDIDTTKTTINTTTTTTNSVSGTSPSFFSWKSIANSLGGWHWLCVSLSFSWYCCLF